MNHIVTVLRYTAYGCDTRWYIREHLHRSVCKTTKEEEEQETNEAAGGQSSGDKKKIKVCSVCRLHPLRAMGC